MRAKRAKQINRLAKNEAARYVRQKLPLWRRLYLWFRADPEPRTKRHDVASARSNARYLKRWYHRDRQK